MILALSAVLCALLATVISFLARRYLVAFGNGYGDFYDTDSPWYRMRMHLWLAAMFGALAPLITRDPAKALTLALVAGLFANLFVVDLGERLLPNRLNWLADWVVLAGHICSVLLGERFSWLALLGPLVAGGLTAGFYALIRLIPRTGIGLGDVKLALATGTILAWVHGVGPLYGVLIAYVVFAAQNVVPILTKKVNIKTAKAPFGPAMILSAMLVCAWFGMPAALS